jgi:nitroreductase/NAD-dependent dihydropyrimidine dehydrogenase PreA subunit
MLNFRVQKDRCNLCGLCVADCPSHIIEQHGDDLPFVSAENEENCVQCQHCLAVCPTAAVSVFGLNPDDSLPVSPEVWPQLDQMIHLLRGRRSVRKYADRNVDPQLIDRLLATVANSPTGINNRLLTFTVLDDKDKVHRLREKVMAALVKALNEGRIPERFAYVERAISAYAEYQLDVIFRGAPHVLIVSAPPHSPCAIEDVPIALSYFELLAQSAGLGTVWCGLIKLAFESVPELKSLVDLPQGHHYYAMLFGHPAIRYARTVQRDTAAAIKRPTVG